MELIIIRGRQNDGKTTTATMLHNDIVNRGARVRLLRTNGNYLSVENWMVDFQSVLDLMKKRIVIISEGDDDDRLAELMEELTDDYRPDIVVVCARSYNREGSSYRMLTERYADIMVFENEFWTEFSEDPTQMYNIKKAVINKIINRILSL